MDITFEQFVTERTNVFNKNLWGLSLDSLQRFTEKIALGPFNEKLQSHCWEWGASLSSGYGVVYLYQPKKLAIRAHKLSHELVNGPVPPTWHVHHKCVNRLCVNPAHLEALEPSEHLSNREGSGAFLNKNKTHCKWGHEFTPDNTRLRVNGNWIRRDCLTCEHDRNRRSSLR